MLSIYEPYTIIWRNNVSFFFGLILVVRFTLNMQCYFLIIIRKTWVYGFKKYFYHFIPNFKSEIYTAINLLHLSMVVNYKIYILQLCLIEWTVICYSYCMFISTQLYCYIPYHILCTYLNKSNGWIKKVYVNILCNVL